MREEITYSLIGTLKEEQYVFAYSPDAQWLQSSGFLRCPDEDRHQLAASSR